MVDRFGLPISTSSPAAADAFISAVDNLLAAGPEPDVAFDTVIALDPGFALAHLARARTAQIYADRDRALASLARARELAAGTTRRERQAIAALGLVVEGQSEAALAAIRAHVQEFPRDVLVLQPATATFGLIGFSGRLTRDEELAELLRPLARHYADDWWFQPVHGFAELEAGDIAAGARLVELGLERAPLNGNAAHVQAHVLYESGKPGAGAEFLRGFLARYSSQGLLRGHLAWHRALFELREGRAADAWRAYDEEFGAPLRGGGPRTPPLNVLTDAVSWLWRSELAGEPSRPGDWRLLADLAKARFPRGGLVFADLHSALAFTRTGDRAAFDRLLAELRALGAERMACAAAADLAQGFDAYARGALAEAAQLLASRRTDNVAVGGSQAQRDLVNETLLRAYRELGDPLAADALRAWRPQLAR